MLIATILSAQCTDERVNMSPPTLFKKYPIAGSVRIRIPREIEQEIRSTGFFRNKTKSIMGASQRIVEEFSGKVPNTMEELLTLPGVARKTANVVLGTAFGIPSGVVVDTHVQRLSERLDLTKNTDPKKIEQGFDANYSAGQMDPLLAPVDLAWAACLPSPQAEMHRLQSGIALLFERQDRIAGPRADSLNDRRSRG